MDNKGTSLKIIEHSNTVVTQTSPGSTGLFWHMAYVQHVDSGTPILGQTRLKMLERNCSSMATNLTEVGAIYPKKP